ncbi:N,N-dimethylformamidase beta subunit family domain-containing protein [Maribacter algicola]|uniref:N,N-dimethylformamidase beta subunit family domain-containing protein n=1 Tax=Meishania litoralis TaxID=3434685 RepID=A0ACC7LNZ5_9FLAO
MKNEKMTIIYSVALCLLASCGPIVDGYTDKISYRVGDSLKLYLNGRSTNEEFEVAINDLQGNPVKTYNTKIFSQKMSNDKPYTNGFGYSPTLEIAVPNLRSGVYTFGEEIPFVVRPSEPFDILVLYSSNTENAYANSGGKSLYDYNSSSDVAAPIVSFQRPIGLPVHSTEFLIWIANQKQYKIGYICDQDMDDYENIENAKLLIIPGHSEYWTRKARINFDRFIDEGKNALILSGNTMWWQVRYSSDGSKMICYKDFESDPIGDILLKTINWPDTLLHYSTLESIGVDFNYGGYGKKSDDGWDGFKIVKPESPIFKGLDIKMHDILWVKTHEYDGADLDFSVKPGVILNNPYGFYKYDLIGYDLASRKPNSNAAWVVLQREPGSGLILNTSSTDWCAEAGMEGRDSDTIKAVTLNMIDLLLSEADQKAFN